MASALYLLSPAASKRLIGAGVAASAPVRRALEAHTLVIVAGSTNACVAAEILGPEFPCDDFLRGSLGPKPGRGRFPGDVVLRKGSWDEGKEIFDVVDELGPGDVILKGANALDYGRRRAAVLVADPNGGTILCALRAVVGRRAELIVPVGLEKLVYGDPVELSGRMNAPGGAGWRLFPLPAEPFTEIEALRTLAGASAHMVAAGGVGGAEGSVLLLVEGSPEALRSAEERILRAGGRRGG